MTFTNDQWQEAIVFNANNPPGGGTQYTDGQTPPTNPIGPTLVWDNGGTWLHVSAAHPLPISGSISATNPSVSTTGTAIPTSATLVGASDGTNLQPLLVDASKFLKVSVAASTTIPVSGTFWQAVQPISQPTSSTGTLSSVAAATASTQLLASNASRKGAYVYNDSTAIMYLALNGTASTTSYTTQVGANDFYECPTSPVYTGAISAVWASATGNARITEMS